MVITFLGQVIRLLLLVIRLLGKVIRLLLMVIKLLGQVIKKMTHAKFLVFWQEKFL